METILISTDKTRLDINFIHRYLSQHAYWCEGIPKSTVEKSIQHSLCFGVYLEGAQIGFARVITDYATFGYLADVFIDKSYRGQGFSKMLMDEIMCHSELQGLRRFMLITADAHGLYEKFEFTPLAKPERVMEIAKPTIYQQN